MITKVAGEFGDQLIDTTPLRPNEQTTSEDFQAEILADRVGATELRKKKFKHLSDEQFAKLIEGGFEFSRAIGQRYVGTFKITRESVFSRTAIDQWLKAFSELAAICAAEEKSAHPLRP